MAPFWHPKSVKIRLKSTKIGRRWAKVAPTWAKMGQVGPKMASSWSQDGSKTAQDEPKGAPRCPRGAPGGKVVCWWPTPTHGAPQGPLGGFPYWFRGGGVQGMAAEQNRNCQVDATSTCASEGLHASAEGSIPLGPLGPGPRRGNRAQGALGPKGPKPRAKWCPRGSPKGALLVPFSTHFLFCF